MKWIKKYDADLIHFPQVYRLNLEQGRFLAPLEASTSGVNVMGVNPVHGLIVSAKKES